MSQKSKKIVVLHYFGNQPIESEIITLLGNPIEIEHINCGGDISELVRQIRLFDGQVDAIALDGVSKSLRLGNRTAVHKLTSELFSIAEKTPVLDGSVLLPAIERWSVRLAHGNEPGIWAHKRVLMMPSLNHTGMSEALAHHADNLQTADHLLFSDLDQSASGGFLDDLRQVKKDDRQLLDQLKSTPFEKIFYHQEVADQSVSNDPLTKLLDWSDIIAGDSKVICHYATSAFERKIVVVPFIDATQVSELMKYGVSVIVTLLPNLSHDKHVLARHSASILEACLTALAFVDHVGDEDGTSAETKRSLLGESEFLNLLAEIEWQPTIRYLKSADVAVNHFGFITQPYNVSEIRENIPVARWLPKAFIHRTSVHIPPVFHGRMENIQAIGSRKKAVGEIMMLGGTPEEFAAQEVELVAHRILRAASMAERLEARLIGADTASREVSDAISAIAPKTNVPICSGQAMTIYGSLVNGVKIAVENSVSLGQAFHGTVVNAADPIAAVAAEVLAGLMPTVTLTLIGSEPDILIQLKRRIEDIHIKATVEVSTNSNEAIRRSDLLILGRNIAGKRMIFTPEICKAGAVICDFSQPTIITPDNLTNRPDLTLIESALFRLPEASTGKAYSNLPHGLVSAAFAEASLLAIQGNFVDYGLAGELSSKHVYDIRDLAIKGNYLQAGILAHGQVVAQAQIKHRKELANQFRLHQANNGISQEIGQVVFNEQPARPSVRRFAREHSAIVATGVGILAVIAGVASWFFKKRKGDDPHVDG